MSYKHAKFNLQYSDSWGYSMFILDIATLDLDTKVKHALGEETYSYHGKINVLLAKLRFSWCMLTGIKCAGNSVICKMLTLI